MYDKKRKTWSHAGLADVAQQAGFYGAETEKKLANEVESPGNRVLDKLRERQGLSDQERMEAAVYIATMLERVPKRRNMVLGSSVESCGGNPG